MSAEMTQDDGIRITINGEDRTVQVRTVGAVLDGLGIPAAGTAVELDGQIVPARALGETEIREGAKLEIVRLVGGG